MNACVISRTEFLSVLFLLTVIVVACGEESPETVARGTPAAPSPTAMSYLQGAMRMAQQGDFDGARAAVERAKRVSPGSPDVFRVEGQVLLAAGDFHASRESLLRAIELHESDSRAWELLGHASFQDKRFRDAIDAYGRAAAMDPTPFVWQGIGAAYQELYLPDSAAVAYRRVLDVDSTFAPAWAALAEIAEDEGAYQEALAMAEHASRVAPRSASYTYLRARLLVAVGRPAEAVPILAELVHADSTHYGAVYTLGRAYQATGQDRLATETLERAARIRSSVSERREL